MSSLLLEERARLITAGDEGLRVTVAGPYGDPVLCSCAYGRTLQQLINEAIADGLIAKDALPFLRVWIDDIEFRPELWRRVKPRAGREVSLRAKPGWEFALEVALNIAIAVAVNALIKAFTPDPKQISIDQLAQIDASRNEIPAPYRKVPAIFGTFRVFPPHGAKAYTEAIGERVFVRMLLLLGVGSYALTSDSGKAGDTPLDTFSGVEIQTKLAPGDPMPTLFPGQVDEDEGPGRLEFADDWVERVTSADDLDELQAELAFPEGLIRYKDDGSSVAFAVEFRVRYKAEGAADWLDWETDVVAADGHYYNWSRKAAKPFRETLRKTGVTRGTAYRIGIKRISWDPEHVNNKNWFDWTKVRSIKNEPPILDENLSFVCLRMEAGDQLNGVVDQINWLATTIVPKWDADEEEFAGWGESSNPAELVRWIATGPGAPKARTAGEIDDAAFGAWAELCTLKDWRCDFELRVGASQAEVMEQVARCGRASLVTRGGKLTPVIDDIQPARTQLFGPRNSWGFRAQRRWPSGNQALRARFNNSAKGYVADEMLVPFPGYTTETAERIADVALIGKVRDTEVFRDTKRAIAEEMLRGEDYSWRADWENLSTSRGKRTAIAHYSIAVGRTHARVKAVTLNVPTNTHVTHLVLDEIVEQTGGDLYGLAWRRIEGAAITVEQVALTTVAGKSATVQLATMTPIASAPKVGDAVEFGDAEIETLDVVVQNIARASDFEAEITAVAYTEAIVADDDTDLPPWSSNVSGDAFPPPPAAQLLGVVATTEAILVAFGFPAGTEQRVLGVEAWWKDKDDDGAFEPVSALGADARQAIFPPGSGGHVYQLKLITVGVRGRRTASEIYEVTSGAPAPPATLPFTPVKTSNMSVVGRVLFKNATTDPVHWDDDAGLLWDDGAPMGTELLGWNGRVFSAESFLGGAKATAIVSSIDTGWAFGLATEPAADDHFDNINWCWTNWNEDDGVADGKRRFSVFGVTVWDNDGDPEDWEINDVAEISYDNAFIRAFISGVLKYEIAVSPNIVTFFDSGFFDDNASLEVVAFSAPAAAGTSMVTLFKRSISPPARPTGDNPEGWSRAVPQGEEPVWEVTGAETSGQVLIGEWSEPVKRPGLFYRGAYDATATYYFENEVSFEGGSYALIVHDAFNVAPSGTNQATSFWRVVAAPPDDPPPGTPGGGFTDTITLSSSVVGLNLYDIARAEGWDGFEDATIEFVLPSGQTVTGSPGAPHGGIGIDTGLWPSGPTLALKLTIEGEVYGGGGEGGDGSASGVGEDGGRGGHAINCRVDCTIEFKPGSKAKGGGGAGGGGNARSTGFFQYFPGGGGGGGQPNGPGGAGAATFSGSANNGAAGTMMAPGARGTSSTGHDGVIGGVFGMPGGSNSNAGQPGAAGSLVKKNGKAVTVINNSTDTAGAVG